MKVIVNGAAGHMGWEVLRLIEEGTAPGAELAAAVDAHPAADMYSDVRDYTGPADVLIDFSHHTAAPALAAYAAARGIPLVMATTGHTEEEVQSIRDAAAHVPVFYSANMSLGVALLVRLARQTAACFPDADIEIIEKHHNRKLDAPSGTALMLANAIRDARSTDAPFVFGRHGQQKREPGEIGIHAVRLGSDPGEHEVLVSTGTQTISLKHTSHTRAIFAEGALTAAAFLIGRAPGLYNMQDLADGQN